MRILQLLFDPKLPVDRIMTANNNFTDIKMPKMDGWEISRPIKAIKPGIFTITITGEHPNNIFTRLSESASGIGRKHGQDYHYGR